jgi:ankyrin repeat protein
MSIHEAAELGNIEAVKQHLAAGTDVDVKGGWLGGTPLHYAARDSHKEIIELLIAKGADLNAKGSIGQTSLHDATERGHKETAELLIATGADVNAKDMYGETPLHFAIIYNKTNIADLLRKHGGKTGEELKAAEPVAEVAQPDPPTAKAILQQHA